MPTQRYTEGQIETMARESYRHGNAGYEVKTEDCALLVIDMQDEFVKPGWTPYWIPEATRQVHRIRSLIDHCRHIGIPVLFTVYSNRHHQLDRYPHGRLLPNRFPDLDIDQSAFFMDGRIVSELKPRPEEIVIHKPSYGAFYDTPLDTILKHLGKGTVIICGTMTNYCCGATARQAYERGYKVLFGADITSTDIPEMQETELMVLRRGFAKVWSVEEIMNHLK